MRWALDRVLFIPTNIPRTRRCPNTQQRQPTAARWVRLLTKDTPWAQLDTMEIDRGGGELHVWIRCARCTRGRNRPVSDRSARTCCCRLTVPGARQRKLCSCVHWRSAPARRTIGQGCGERRSLLHRSMHAHIELVQGPSITFHRPSCGRAARLRRYTAPRGRRIISSEITFTVIDNKRYKIQKAGKSYVV